MYGVMNDDTSIISVLLKYRADPHPKDMRDRSALYWAALKGGRDTFDAIVGAISPNQKTEFSRAIFAAIAANRVDFVSKLLEIVQIHPETEDSDGWSLSYTVQRFRNEAIATVVLPHSQQPGKVACQRVFKSPTRWHTMDRAPFLRLSLSGRSINVVESLDSDLGYGLARADYPIHPAGADAMFSFEIRIDAIGAGNE
ncbi:hypothetical protein F4779DRAFT_34629 [Xylariaceae sp. FL0662B]|nr:hypothetical protein F4779DRAFT_34629 [Xylariaceae sp. FL0662B]